MIWVKKQWAQSEGKRMAGVHGCFSFLLFMSWIQNMNVCCIQALDLGSYRGMWSAGLGSVAASSSAAVGVGANGSAIHQSWSRSGPTADCAATRTRLKKTDKTVMSLYLMGHNSRIGSAVLREIFFHGGVHVFPPCSFIIAELCILCIYIYMCVFM